MFLFLFERFYIYAYDHSPARPRSVYTTSDPAACRATQNIPAMTYRVGQNTDS